MKPIHVRFLTLALVFPALLPAFQPTRLVVADSQYRLAAGGTRAIRLDSESARFVAGSDRISSSTFPLGESRIGVGVDGVDKSPFLFAPFSTPAGTYSVQVSAQSKSGEERTATVQVTVDPLPPLAAGARPPVILMNGWQVFCLPAASSASTFGNLEQYLKRDGSPSVLFFDNCRECPGCLIEELGSRLGQVISLLRDTDGAPVPQVDVIAHSMGGLIARSYLSGKQSAPGSFSPPADPRIRKLVMIATPHFGTFATETADPGTQLYEMLRGSQFLWDLATWNQNTDDLRETDALSIVGNAGSWGTLQSASDGIVSLTSGSLSFAFPRSGERTRVVTYCHTSPVLISFTLGRCAGGEIANVDTDSHLTYRIVRSFLGDTADWKTIGSAPSADSYLSRYGGLYLMFKTPADLPAPTIDGAQYTGASGAVKLSRGSGSNVFWDEWAPNQAIQLQPLSGPSALGPVPFTNMAGGFIPVGIKSGPVVALVQAAAARLGTLSLAPGSLVSIYGANLASATAKADALPLPSQLADATVAVNGQRIGLLYVSSGQINAYLPANLSGLAKITVSNSSGQHSLNVLLSAAVPAVFSMDGSGAGLAAAINATTGALLDPAKPLHAGDIVSLYLTGLGDVTRSGAFDVTKVAPSVYIYPGAQATVSYSGLAPGFTGLYQINFQIPEGSQKGAAVPMAVIAGKYTSNLVTLPIQ